VCSSDLPTPHGRCVVKIVVADKELKLYREIQRSNSRGECALGNYPTQEKENGKRLGAR
jgi:hypothetical protein